MSDTPNAATPAPAVDMSGWTPEQKDLHWLQNVYQGDRMKQLTLRAVLTGGILGMLMSASNLYTTLSVGWAFGVAITASVISFVIWSTARPISNLIPTVLLHAAGAVGFIAALLVPALLWQNGSWPMGKALAIGLPIAVGVLLLYALLRSARDPMTILETNCMASTASSAGYSTGSTIATMFGALVLLAIIPDGKTSKDVTTLGLHPWWLVGGFTLCTGLMGVFLAIPMKRQMINHEQLAFPSGIAAAETLRSLYSGSVEAVQKAYFLMVGLALGAVIAILRAGQGTFNFLDSFYKSTGLLIPHQLPHDGFYKVNNKQMIGFGFETSALLIAAGMIVGLRVSLSMLLGSAILYFWLGPMLIAQDAPNLLPDGKAFVEGYVPSIEVVGGGATYHLFRWGLWGGTALLVFSSLTSLAFQWKTIIRAFVPAKATGDAAAHADRLAAVEVPGLWMLLGMVPITIAMLLIQILAFEISWWAGLIAIGLSFVLSLVACRATGETDTTPIGAMGKVMQLLFAVLKPEQVVPNLASAGIAANAASSSADLLTDLKIGYLLGANPRRQFIAQFFGVFFGTLAIV
ncbi:MAG TPA: OPT/YSL family transporter, partial [Phycisphaerales bacterium]